jgi:hypothetical protein
MRMMMKVKMDTEKANRGIADGSLPRLLGEAMTRLQPEAAYFGPDGGVRTAFIVFDLKDPSEIPSISEVFFTGANATVEMFPVMDRGDLQKGLQQISHGG